MNKFIVTKTQYNQLVENKKTQKTIINNLIEIKSKINPLLFESHIKNKLDLKKKRGLISEQEINKILKNILI